MFADGHDGSVFQRVVARPTAHARRAREAVVHRARRVRAGVRQGQPAHRLVVQRHEEDQKPRVLRPLVQPSQLFGGVRNMQGTYSRE